MIGVIDERTVEVARTFIKKADQDIQRSRDKAHSRNPGQPISPEEVRLLRAALDELTYAVGTLVGGINWHDKERT